MNNKIEQYRKNKLINKLQENKLMMKHNGDCYSYIKYGHPGIEQVINNELLKTEYKTNRKIKLAKKLSKLNIVLDESLPSCYNYINNLGCKSLNDIVQNIEIEYFLKHHTKYDKLIKIHSPSKAKNLALRNFVFSDNQTITEKVPEKIRNNSIILSFD